MRNFLTLTAFTVLLLPAVLWGQTINTEFGKNRIQYHDDFDEWSEYESDNFVTYWYGAGRNVGQAVVQIAEYEFAEIQNILEHRLNDRIEIIVYVDLTDLKQSNIGSEEAFENTTGQTKILGNKMFVYFNGDHTDLRRQIREGIASVFLNNMLFGSNLQEIVQNAVMMNLPQWFKLGLVSYCGTPWNTKLDDQLRDLIRSEAYKDFEKFATENPKLAGHSMWYYINANYGNSTVSNLLYLTRINRSVESGFLYVLGVPYERIMASWAIYFTERYEKEAEEFDPYEASEVEIKNRKNLPLLQVKLSPDGKKLAYVTNDIGKAKVYIHDLETGRRERIFKNGFRNAIQATDYNYPLLAWNPSGFQLAIVYEKRDVAQLTIYDVNTGKKETEPLDPQYQRVYTMDYLDNNTLVFSAAVRGFSDLYLYFTNTRQTRRLTQDFWDDLDATVVNVRNQRGILFASNRQDSLLRPAKLDTILPTGDFDIFYFDLKNKPGELVRVTNTPLANERNPFAIDTTWFGYLSDESGIYNRSTGYLEDYVAFYEQAVKLVDGSEIVIPVDSVMENLDTNFVDTIVIRPVIKTRAITHFQTNRERNIHSIHTAPRVGKSVEKIYENGQYRVVINTIRPATEIVPKPTRYKIDQLKKQRLSQLKTQLPKNERNVLTPSIEPAPAVEQPPATRQDTGKIDIDNYFFQTPFDKEEMPSPKPEIQNRKNISSAEQAGLQVIAPSSKRKEVFRFRPARIIPYRLKFRTDYVTTQLDNNLLFDGLNSFAGTPQDFSLPPPGILLKANFKDLLEDYVIEGGVRIPTTFNGTEYFLLLDDKKNRIDKRYAVYRRAFRNIEDQNAIVPQRSETVTVIGLTQFRYPLDIFRSLRATTTFRMDRLAQLSTDANTLNTPSVNEQRLGLRLEYVFDNTLDISLNIKNGTRYKIYSEVVKRLHVDFGKNAAFSFGEGAMGIIGFDARHYIPILKHSVFAARAAGATSFGSEKILFYLGGVENWLFPEFNNTIPLPESENFAYQTIAANLRGFDMNIRNGNSYALINTELRIPVFKYLFPKSKSSFFRNFQAVGFFDAGTAWEGFSPFSDENPLNTVTLPDGGIPGKEPVVLRVNYFRDPVVAGYGIGARVLLFGYFLRLDYAWGIETRVTQEPLLYISLGTDF